MADEPVEIGIAIFHLFGIRERRIKMNRPISPILTLKLVAMATSLERTGKGRSNQQSTPKYLPFGENVVKIGPVDREITR